MSTTSTTTSYVQQYPRLQNYSVDDLTKTYNYLTDAIKNYQTLESSVWNQKQLLQNANYPANQQNFLTQQKLVKLQADRDNVMQKLLAEYGQNTAYHDAAQKMQTDSQYINQLQGAVYNANLGKLGSLNSDIMTYSRVSSINTESFRYIFKINTIFKITIVFECILLLLFVCIYSFSDKIQGKEGLATLLMGLIFFVIAVYIIVLLWIAWINRNNYRMLTIEKDYIVPSDSTTTDESNCPVCTTTPTSSCPTTSGN